MSAVIVIEIVIGIVVLAAAVRFAVRDTRRRSQATPEQEVESADTVEAPAGDSEPEPEQHLTEVGSTEPS
jgi:hypothetical protein